MATAHIQTDDDELADELTRLALLADVAVTRGGGGGPVPAEAGLVVADAAAPLARSVGRDLVVVTRGSPSVAVLSASLEVGAAAVVSLPSESARLVEELRARTRLSAPGRLVAVVGATGGVGATTFAVACAEALAPSLLVDCDDLGGGLDVALDLERAPGPRWSNLGARGAALSGPALREALPRAGEVSVLSNDGCRVGGDALAAVLSAGREDGGPVVLDLPRAAAAGLLDRARAQVDELLIVLADDVPGVIAASRLAAALRTRTARAQAVLLRAGGGVPSELVEQTLELPVAGRLSLEGRQSTPASPRRAWVRTAREVLG